MSQSKEAATSQIGTTLKSAACPSYAGDAPNSGQLGAPQTNTDTLTPRVVSPSRLHAFTFARLRSLRATEPLHGLAVDTDVTVGGVVG